MNRLQRPAAAALLLLLLTGCGGSDGEAESSPTAGAAASSGTATTGAGSEGDPAAPMVDVEEALLSADDLPAGWTGGSDPVQEKTFCDYTVAHEATDAVASLFTTDTELLGVTIRQYDSAEAASQVVDQMRDVLDSCSRDTIEGDPVTYADLEVDPVGDDTIGVEVVADLQGVELSVYRMFVLRGTSLIQVEYAVPGSTLEVETLQGFAQQQLEKYDAAAQTA